MSRTIQPVPNEPSGDRLSRRLFLGAGVGGVFLGGSLWVAEQPVAPSQALKPAEPGRKLRVAAINSIFRLRSHAYHIVGRMVHGFQKDGVHHQPDVQVARMFNHQSPPDDLSQGFCKRHGIELCKTLEQSLGNDGGLDVDAVALIIEHGDYPVNEFGQVEYPRYELFQQVVEVFEKQAKRADFCG